MAGRLIHFEIPAADTARARQFYGSLFDWEFSAWEGPVEYHTTSAGGDPGGAVYPRQADEGIRVWFDTDDLDAHIERVRGLGGEATDREPIPGIGWFTLCRDTEGNRFGIMQSDPSAEPPGR